MAQCDRILSEIIEGEARLNDGDGLRSKLHARLGLVEPAAATALDRATQASTSDRHKLRPGKRKPGRDPVGQPAYAGCL